MILKTIIIRPEISIVISCLIKNMSGTISASYFISLLIITTFTFTQLMMSILIIFSLLSLSFPVLFFILLSSLIIISLLLV